MVDYVICLERISVHNRPCKYLCTNLVSILNNVVCSPDRCLIYWVSSSLWSGFIQTEVVGWSSVFWLSSSGMWMVHTDGDVGRVVAYYPWPEKAGIQWSGFQGHPINGHARRNEPCQKTNSNMSLYSRCSLGGSWLHVTNERASQFTLVFRTFVTRVRASHGPSRRQVSSIP